MSVNSNPVNLFIPHEHYKFDVELTKNHIVEKVLRSSKLKGTLLALTSIVNFLALAVLSSPAAAALFTVTLPAALPMALVSFGMLTLALSIYFFIKKSTVVEQEKLPVKFLAEKHWDEIQLAESFFNGDPAKYEQGKSVLSLRINLLTILSRPEFKVDPIGYIAKWVELRGGEKLKKEELKSEEDFLLYFFTSPNVQKYLVENFTALPQNAKPNQSPVPSTVPQSFVPHKHYKWSLAENDKVTKFTYDHLERMGSNLDCDVTTEFGSNLFTILTQKDFLASPVEYIAKWKASRGTKKTEDTEGCLLAAFESENVRKYLAENFTPKAI